MTVSGWRHDGEKPCAPCLGTECSISLLLSPREGGSKPHISTGGQPNVHGEADSVIRTERQKETGSLLTSLNGVNFDSHVQARSQYAECITPEVGVTWAFCYLHLKAR